MAEPAQQVDHFPHILVQSDSRGTITRIIGTRLKVHDIVSIWRVHGEDADEVSREYYVDRALVDEALAYAASHPDQIEDEIRYTESFTFEQLQAILPTAQQFVYQDDPEQA